MTRDIDVKDLWGKHELSIIPLSLFKPNGDMRTGNDKSKLKRSLKIEVSRRSVGNPNVIIVDFSALLYHIEWPTKGKLSDVTNAILHWLNPLLEHSDVYIVCDRYYNKSPKGWLREVRSGDRAQHMFMEATILGVTENKIQILNHVFKDIPLALIKQLPTNGRCVITGSSPIPVEIHRGIIKK